MASQHISHIQPIIIHWLSTPVHQYKGQAHREFSRVIGLLQIVIKGDSWTVTIGSLNMRAIHQETYIPRAGRRLNSLDLNQGLKILILITQMV
jgi:hypothetical protein